MYVYVYVCVCLCIFTSTGKVTHIKLWVGKMVQWAKALYLLQSLISRDPYLRPTRPTERMDSYKLSSYVHTPCAHVHIYTYTHKQGNAITRN